MKAHVYPGIPLAAEWSRQAQNLAGLFAKELKFKTQEEYIATLPKLEPQPDAWRGRFDTPLIVETRVSPKRQAELLGMRNFLDGLKKTDGNTKKKYVLPKAPYTTWLNNGKDKFSKAPNAILKNLKADEIAANELDGIALYIANPDILDYQFLYLPGTIVEREYAAFLDLWYGLPRLDFNFVDSALPKFGVVLRGRLA